MAWKETCAMEERFRFIEAYRLEEAGLAELCRRFDISRKTGYKWLERYEAGGLEALKDRPRAPQYHPNRVIEEVEAEILKLRQKHPHWGPLKLRAKLEREAVEIVWPAASTIGELLKRKGLSSRRNHHRKATPSLSPMSHATAPNQVWSADFKGWFRCLDGKRCDPLTISDGYSRYVLRCQVMESMEEGPAQRVFRAAFDEYGLPDGMRNDNGEPFASVGIGGLSRLSIWWIKLGLRIERIKPGKPQQNGRHERMHRVLKQEAATPPAANLRRQQEVFDQFRQEYNWERPHQALEMKTPGDLYVASAREYPSRIEGPKYPGEWEVRAVGPCGTMRWKSEKIYVGKALAGEWIGLEESGDGEWKVRYYNHPLAILDERRRKLRKWEGDQPESQEEAGKAIACGSKE
jgi:putative transposase